MRLGITCYPTVGGSGAVAAELGKQLARRGHDVHFISYRLPFRLEDVQQNICFHEVDVSSYPLFEYPPHDLALAVKMAEVAREHRLELFHVHYAIPHAITGFLAQQMLGDKAFIDDVFAQKYASFYVDLHKAYAQASRLGDVLAAQIVQSFPDKFPGDPTAHAVDVRVAFNVWLQEHAYLATIATDAVVAGRNSEKTAAASALAANADLLGTAFATTFGSAAATQFNTIWAARDKALLGYASGDVQSKQALTETFVTAFVSFGRVDKAHARNQVMATIRVIDDQRAKSKSVAGDDRAAATAMQPIADSIQS